MIATYVDIMYMYLVSSHIYELKWTLERCLSITSSMCLMFTVFHKKAELTAVMKKAYMKNSAPEKKINALVGCILVSPLIYSLGMLLACAVGKDKRGFLFFFYRSPVEDNRLKYSILFWKSFLYHFLYPTYSNLVILVFCTICHRMSLTIKNLSIEVERCPPKAFTTIAQIRCLKCETEIYKTLEELQTNFSIAIFIACAGNFLYCFSLLSQVMMFSFRQNASTYQADSVVFSITVVVPLIVMFWIPEWIPEEMENLNRIIRFKYEMRASSGLVSRNSTVEKWLLEGKIILSGCNMIFLRKSSILSVLGTALIYGLLLMSLELRK
ncbi:hypothetical protein HNY73_009691 [Argiope bruennichi]|uniref:Gustatory receptor n=1 Tax=Argiope bruennichi TaxID=94029 RepID=A0A8T0FFE9_ARGBR|nr:hypothetical protein HNY73_009691 [Argiope bruennichi]